MRGLAMARDADIFLGGGGASAADGPHYPKNAPGHRAALSALMSSSYILL